MKYIMFSTAFPSYHPRAGQPTESVEKIWAGLDLSKEELHGYLEGEFDKKLWDIRKVNTLKAQGEIPKSHTIRGGKRFKDGDWFDFRAWAGRPYHSRQISFAPPAQVRVWNFGINEGGFFHLEGFLLNRADITQIANNDGLSTPDFINWFTEPFEGQIICWNPKIEY